MQPANVGHIIVYFDGTAFRFGDVTALSQATLKDTCIEL